MKARSRPALRVIGSKIAATRISNFCRWRPMPKGRVRFYGPDDVLIGEFGPHEGTITSRYARYWFENCGDEDLELLQVTAYAEGAHDSGRTDAAPQRFLIANTEQFSGEKV